MGSKSNNRRKQAQIENTRAYLHYFNRLKQLALIRVEWNLPDEINIDYLNEVLLSHNAVFFYDDGLEEYVALECVLEGTADVYGVPVNRRAIGLNGYTNVLNKSNSVLIKCVPSKAGSQNMTPLEGIEYYARQLAEIDRTIVVNVKRQKLPWIIEADKKSELTVEAFFEDVDDSVPMISVDKDFGKFVNILNLNAPLVAPQLYLLKQSIWQEALTFLGITNSAIEKKERVNVSEVETNNAGTVMQRYTILSPYVDACNKINKLFNLDTSVEFRDNQNAEIDGTNENEDVNSNEDEKESEEEADETV